MKIGNIEIPEIAVRYTRAITVDDLLGCGRELRIDLKTGLPFYVGRAGDGTVQTAMFVSPCCTAAVTYSQDDGVLCCKKCWDDVDPRLDQLIDPSKVTATN